MTQNDPRPQLYVLSGAGLSAESGVATFRSAGGIWDQHKLERVCNMLTWKEHRDEVFDFYGARRAEVAAVAPNAAHVYLAAWQARWGVDRVRLLTQNVDDLLERGGAAQVVHLHGNLRDLHCTACDTYFTPDAADYNPRTRCPRCGSLRGVKPAVVFFNQAAPEYWHLKQVVKRVRPQDVVLVVGTAFQVVTPGMLLPVSRRGHELNWQVNPQPDEAHWFGVNLVANATDGLAQLAPKLEECMEC